MKAPVGSHSFLAHVSYKLPNDNISKSLFHLKTITITISTIKYAGESNFQKASLLPTR